jgi:hypothetical protein
VEPAAYGLKFAGSVSGGSLTEDRVLDKAAGCRSQRNGLCCETGQWSDIGDHCEQGRSRGR